MTISAMKTDAVTPTPAAEMAYNQNLVTRTPTIMSNWKRLLFLVLFAITGFGGLALAIGILFTDFVVDFWWHQELGFGEFFWLKLLYRYILSGAVTLFFFLIFFLNFTAATRYLGVDTEEMARLSGRELGRRQRFVRLFQTGSMRLYTPLSLLMAVLIAAPFYREWHQALLFVFAPEAGTKDFIFQEDVSFYLFSFPIYQLIQHELMLTSMALLVGISLLYAV